MANENVNNVILTKIIYLYVKLDFQNKEQIFLEIGPFLLKIEEKKECNVIFSLSLKYETFHKSEKQYKFCCQEPQEIILLFYKIEIFTL